MKRKMFCLVASLVALMAEAGAQYLQQGTKLVGTGAASSGQALGWSVALSTDGNTAIAGGIFDDHTAGAVWIFTRAGGAWSQQGSKLVGTGASAVAYQGYAVALSADGNTALFGADDDNEEMGAVWVYVRSGGVWTQQGSKLVGTGGVEIVYQGSAVSLSSDGNTALEGGPNDSVGIGAAWVFVRSGGKWTQQGSKLVAAGESGEGNVGHSVSLSGDGNTALLTAPFDAGGAGGAWVFVRSGNAWTQVGSKIIGTDAAGAASQGVSGSLSADGSTAIIGGANDKQGAGAAWVFVRNGSAWTQQGPKLVGTGAAGAALQGSSVSITSDGNTAVVGGPGDNDGVGAVWVFTRSNGLWTQSGGKIVGTGAADTSRQGKAVAISSDGSTIVVGGLGDSAGTGAVWMFANGQTLAVRAQEPLPSNFALYQNYPDPFNPSTTIVYQLPVAAHVTLKVYTVLGQEVATLVDGDQQPGLRSIAWDGEHASSGIYLCRIVATSGGRTFTQVRKMVHAK